MSNQPFGDGDNTWGYHAMRIPENEYHVLMKLLPDLNAKDAETRKRAWRQFANSDLAKQYMTVRQESAVKRSNNHRIIVK